MVHGSALPVDIDGFVKLLGPKLLYSTQVLSKGVSRSLYAFLCKPVRRSLRWGYHAIHKRCEGVELHCGAVNVQSNQF